MTTNLTDDVEQAARRAHGSEGTDKAAKLGFAATGLMHVVVTVLVVLLATGQSDQQADQAGALRTLAEKPFGKALLVAVAAGFLGYTVWRGLEAAVGRRSEDGAARTGKRVLSAVMALGYLVLCGSTLRVALGGGTGDTEQRSDSLTRSALELPAGRWLVGAVALAAVVGGVAMAVFGLRAGFRDKLSASLDGHHERLVVVLGAVGWATRGAVVALLGVFLGKAALQRDPEEARGVDGALHTLAGQPAGQLLLLVVAAGLLAYGLFCFAQAKWRRTQT